MSEAHDLGDLRRLSDWMSAQVADFVGPVEARKFTAGQSNPTYLLSSLSGRYVLRRKPPGRLLESAHAVDREFRVMRALADTDVPVPQMYALCDDDDVVGTMFFVMEYLDGRTLFDPRLPKMTGDDRSMLYDRQLAVLAALAALDVDAIGLGDYGPRNNYFARQIARWTRQYRASETETIDDMERLIVWLEANVPHTPERVSLVHGDYRLDNLRVHRSRPKIQGVIDWELSTLGEPLVDISYFATMLRLPKGRTVGGLADVDRAALGIPSETQMLERFCDLSGLDKPDDWNFYLVFHCFRFVAILQGITKRFLDGNASNATAGELGAMARPIARMGCEILAEA